MQRRTITLLAAALLATASLGLGAALAQSNDDGDDAGDGTPNLTIVALDRQPGDPQPGDAVTFTANVTNDGNATAENVTVAFVVDGSEISNTTVAEIAPGAHVEVDSEPWNATAGEHTVAAEVDPEAAIEETNEDDNRVEATFTVGPDLVPEDLTWSPEDPVDGDDVTFTANVTNDGNSDAGNFTVRFFVDGEQLGNDTTVEGLGAGNTTTVPSDAWNATEGEHTVRVVVDADGNVTESNETNNEAQTTITVAAAPEPEPEPQPDLVAADIEADDHHPEPGQNVTFTAEIENDGDADAGNFTVRFFVDDVQLGNDTTVEGLGAGNATTVASDEWNATEGTHTIRVVVDADDNVTESNETNNEAQTTIVVESEADEPEEPADPGEGPDEETMTICHRPPGNPDNEHTITIGTPAWQAHEGHGDHEGPCEDDASSETSTSETEDDDEDGHDEHPGRGNGRGNGHGNGQGPPSHAGNGDNEARDD